MVSTLCVFHMSVVSPFDRFIMSSPHSVFAPYNRDADRGELKHDLALFQEDLDFLKCCVPVPGHSNDVRVIVHFTRSLVPRFNVGEGGEGRTGIYRRRGVEYDTTEGVLTEFKRS